MRKIITQASFYIRSSLIFILMQIVSLPNAAAQEANNAATPTTKTVAPTSDDDGEHQVIITAQKRSEQLQNAPISVTALDSHELEKMGIESVADVARQTPGLTVVSSGPGQNILIIRGISSTAGTAGTVGYYLDDTPIAASSNASLLSLRGVIDPSIFDIDQVEVLRGPQGTLYGSSSMGGTVRYLTKQPNFDTFQFNLDTSISKTDGGGWNYTTNAVVNIPLVENTVAARIAVFDRRQDGFIDRYTINPTNYLTAPTTAPTQENANSEKTTGIRAIVKFRLEDDLTIAVSGMHQNTFLAAPFQIDVPPGNLNSLIQTRLVPEPSTQISTLANISVHKGYDQFELLSSTSYYDRSVEIAEDASKVLYYFYAPAQQSYIYPTVMTGDYINKEFTQEVRFTSDFKGPWQIIGGAYYHHVNAPLASSIPTPPGYNATFGTQIDSIFAGARQATVSETALFEETSYRISPDLTALVGLRGFRVNQTYAQQVSGEFVGDVASSVTGVSSDTGINPKFNLAWQMNKDVLLFATASKGYRPGGPNNPAPAAVCGAEVATLNLSNSALVKFGPDTLWNYELGEKSAWLDNSLLVDASVYYIDWSQVQQQIVLQCGFNITANFGTATSKGAELEMNYRPIKKLNLRLAGNFTQAKLGNDVPGTPAQKGDPLLDVPRWSASTSAEYSLLMPNGMPGFARVDYSYIGNSIALYDRTSPFYLSKGFSLVNLRVGSRKISESSHWGASLFVDNVFNKIGETGLPTAISADLPDTRRIGINRPRTIGINLKYQM
ncbi:TonB-dependent receptor [Solimicrobium silvestre]|uniref:TonB-dependent Receptor Plug Domain n=1 Tax=Solimicrobium silvestre TaxID=2099400 RepID=A0A2S9GWV7_9BURK|nr:TonB-dependent receptor [Solimicrobium silvestre]PRC92204.1 TonB-dependent Receptor Plug Domain [Solimicrobium silvestre]